jgi:hypothetical protein
MARPRTRVKYPQSFNKILRMADARAACPKCGREGRLRIDARGYMAVVHSRNAVHTVPPDLEPQVLLQTADYLDKVGNALKTAAEELRDVAQQLLQRRIGGAEPSR